ncbi:uncharacterized protein LY89DRAFT_132035 [Mollisia scopiformis]|uniref:2EXR domain-containing protein n=1 Tax=Mollisia scopiformis TaxID=149040 RepID=A0A194X2G9_MOLSC|nr:uncharacterized protein LY89DRAFT_132035 [Mollisia scopiformis]KUJ14204.1 hypothetical protein LY89DRAFT_132035 [Mollisia scopiformis]
MNQHQADSEGEVRKFTCFPRFPEEIKRMIWKWSLAPRVVEVKFDCGGPPWRPYSESIVLYNSCETNPTHSGAPELKKEKCFYTITRTPVALEVCQDSRNAVLLFYPLSFGSVWYHPRIRFNFSLDTLYLDEDFYKVSPLFFSILNNEETTKLRYLALDYDSDGVRPGCGSYLKDKNFSKLIQRSVEGLKALRELIMVQQVQYWVAEAEFDVPGGHFDNRRDLEFDRTYLHETMLPFLKGRFPELRPWTEDWNVCKQTVLLGWRDSMIWYWKNDEGTEGGKCEKASDYQVPWK